MIQIGLTGWSDHPSITTNPQNKLGDYAAHFPIVELDSSFYAIPSQERIQQWLKNTPETFQFIVKAYGPLTQHTRRADETVPLKQLFHIFRTNFLPLLESGKLNSYLFQFPPYFTCVKENVTYLRNIRSLMGDVPIAVEFRHASWFSPDYQPETLKFLKKYDFIHVVVDQPQTPHNSVPFVPAVTNPTQAFLRLHGRNYEGWLGQDQSKDWREYRTLYNYSETELLTLKSTTLSLAKQAKKVAVIFNNNSGGHAAGNAKCFQSLLGINYDGLAPRQLDLF